MLAKYLYEHKKWTTFSWQDKAINTVFGEVPYSHERLAREPIKLIPVSPQSHSPYPPHQSKLNRFEGYLL